MEFIGEPSLVVSVGFGMYVHKLLSHALVGWCVPPSPWLPQLVAPLAACVDEGKGWHDIA